MDIISRKDAIDRGLKNYFTGKSCKRGHKSLRLVTDRVCCKCKKDWKINNKDKAKAISRKADRKFQRNNPDKMNAKNARRRSAKLKRTPNWLTSDDHQLINGLYKKAALFNKYCKQKYQVDHRIPLQGKLVSGLHTPLNLRVIPSKQNLSKGNYYEI